MIYYLLVCDVENFTMTFWCITLDSKWKPFAIRHLDADYFANLSSCLHLHSKWPDGRVDYSWLLIHFPATHLPSNSPRSLSQLLM